MPVNRRSLSIAVRGLPRDVSFLRGSKRIQHWEVEQSSRGQSVKRISMESDAKTDIISTESRGKDGLIQKGKPILYGHGPDPRCISTFTGDLKPVTAVKLAPNAGLYLRGGWGSLFRCKSLLGEMGHRGPLFNMPARDIEIEQRLSEVNKWK